MTEEFIKDFNTRLVIGIVETDDNGDKIARDFQTRQILGYYKKKYNHTTDFYGRVIALGDCVVSLIWQNKK